MNYKPLGSSALLISEIGFGCMSLGSDAGANEQLIHQAIDLGISFFDTADLYDKGKNEEYLGQALKEKRKEVIIATKVGNQWRPDGKGWDWNPHRDYILTAVEGSLKRLGTDYIDLYQLHGGTIQDDIDETISAFEQLVQQGKVRYYGISSIRPNVIREYIQCSKITSVMMQYSLLDRRPEEECFGMLQKHQIGVLARGGLAQGLLVNKPPKQYLNYDDEEVKKAAAAIHSMSGTKRSATQTALRFVIQQPAVTSAVVGIRTSEQLQEAVHTIETPTLSIDELQVLQKAVPVNFYKEHR